MKDHIQIWCQCGFVGHEHINRVGLLLEAAICPKCGWIHYVAKRDAGGGK